MTTQDRIARKVSSSRLTVAGRTAFAGDVWPRAFQRPARRSRLNFSAVRRELMEQHQAEEAGQHRDDLSVARIGARRFVRFGSFHIILGKRLEGDVWRSADAVTPLKNA